MDKVLLVVFLHLLFDVTLCCPGNWKRYSKRKVCFKVFQEPQLTWKSARGLCADHFGDLAKLDDFADQNFINTSLLHGFNGVGIWLGGRHMGFTRNTWKWVDKSKMKIDSFKWLEGNPDNGGGTILEDNEDCLMMRADGKNRGFLNDFSCKKHLPFVCETSEGYSELTTTAQLPSLDETATDVNVKPVLVPLSVLLVVASASIILVVLVRRRKRTLTQTYENMQNVHQSSPEHVYDSLARSGGATMSFTENTQKANNLGKAKFPGVKAVAFQHENGQTKQPTRLEEHGNTKASNPIDQLENSGYFAVKVSEGRCTKPSNLARLRDQTRVSSKPEIRNDGSDHPRPSSGYTDIEAAVAKDTVKAVGTDEYITPIHSENVTTDCYLTPVSSNPPGDGTSKDYSSTIYDEIL